MLLKDKHCIIGITGSIAAYKTANLIRLLIKEGAEVKVIMTKMAKEFVQPLTFATLAKQPILVDFYNPENADWNSHIALATWADVFIIAPATANTIAKMANGIADNLLLTTYLSARCKVFFAPAMDCDMYAHKATQNNINKLIYNGNIIIEPENGELASGLNGKGRMAEPEIIIQQIKTFFQKQYFLKNKKILITLGATHEKIDAVRYIGNYSSGKTGFALAEEAQKRGAEVCVIQGYTEVNTENKNIKIVKAKSADEMYKACIERYKEYDVIIFAAAVADYTPTKVYDTKLKHKDEELTINLKPTKDIAYEIGKIKLKNQISIGFALETNNELENAKRKLQHKNFNFIILNSINNQNTCFNSNDNKITIIHNDNTIIDYDTKHKSLVASDIIDQIQDALKIYKL